MKKHFLFFVALSLIFFVPPSWSKEDPTKYPSKPITMLLAFPGGVVDLTARKLAELASPILGQPIVIEHRPGGSGAIELTALSSAPADGYTIGTISHSATTLIPYLKPVHYKTKRILVSSFSMGGSHTFW
jgi:tripartite-type tricarboxylate transporter receptor subunit TctC